MGKKRLHFTIDEVDMGNFKEREKKSEQQ